MNSSKLYLYLFAAISLMMVIGSPNASSIAHAAPITRATPLEDVPQWLRQAITSPKKDFDKNVPAVVLLKEQRVTVDNEGKVTTSEIGAIKILTREGKKEAGTGFAYYNDSSKVKELHAWLVATNGEIKRYGKDDIVERAAALNDVYNEVRLKTISAASSADEGMIFGYEWTVEEKSFLNQDRWHFQDRMPVMISRYILTLPAGWHAENATFNHEQLAPNVSGTSYTWELRDLPFINEEPSSPSLSSIVPRIVVSYFPPASKTVGVSFNQWVEVSRWLTNLTDAQATADEKIRAKAQSITANSTSEYDRIKAIANFVQHVQYISIQTNLAKGGGYKPHAASDVLAKAYGDCKDKANLMRALLKAVDIPAYLLAIYSGDASYVREEWPSPQQFNHCIIAIKVKDEPKVAAITNHPSLGKLLIFDPTDDITPLGELPDHEQNSLALLVAGDEGKLMRMPVSDAAQNSLERKADFVLNANGSISGQIQESAIGQPAVQARGEFRYLSKPEYQQLMEGWITKDKSQAKISKLEPIDNSAEGKFTLNVEFNADHYGQLMQNRLLVFKPAVVVRRHSVNFVEGSRKYPVQLRTEAFKELTRIRLPEGFAVDELPDAAKINTSFGSYLVNYQIKDGYLLVERSLSIKGEEISPEKYTEVRKFFEQIRTADQAPAVLLKK